MTSGEYVMIVEPSIILLLNIGTQFLNLMICLMSCMGPSYFLKLI